MKHLKSIKTLLSLMLIAILTITAISCGDDVEDPVIYTVTVMTAEGGEADASCYEVIAGEEVTLIATPESGYIFKCWMLNGVEVSRENPYTTVVNKNTVYVAKFVKEGTEEGEGEGENEDNPDTPTDIKTLDILAEIEKDEMVFVHGGSYNMGATEEQGSEAKADESPVHLVMLSDYYISRYEVTQKFWETIMGTNPSSTKGEDLPVDNVSWEECNQFIQELNKRTGKNFSLPTEAEWEYAARGGKNQTATKYSGSNKTEEVAWSDAIDGTIQNVGTKKYNELGIYDMSGNVSEWCYDWYGAYTEQDQTNPIGATDGTKRVLRGGNISSANTYCRVSTRNSLSPDGKQAKTGFRIVLSKPTYKVTAKPSTEEGGSITINSNYVREGGKATLTATPKENNHFVNWTVEGKEVSTQNPYTTTITEDIEIKANFKETKGIENGYTWIDLGLPSGLKWATCNVGATKPEEYGDYFAWGEIKPKQHYYYDNYTYKSNPETLPLSADAARVNWGGSWRMPTIDEQEELINTNNCTWTWTTQNGVNGYKVTSKKNGNSIFLPAAGYRASSNLGIAGSHGAYWSSSHSTVYSFDAYYLYFNSNYVNMRNENYRYDGQSVRAVCP